MTAPAPTIDIKVATPLPSSVLLTLGNLIEAAWPGAELADNEDRFTSQVIFRVNTSARQVIEDAAAAALLIEPGEDDVEITALGPKGVNTITPEIIAQNFVPVIKAAFENFPDAANYLEMPLRDPADGHRYLLTFCRSAAQTPHELRLKAERERDAAHNMVRNDYTAALSSLQRLPRGHREDTYAEGVRAALEALLSLGNTGDGADDGSEG